MSEQQIFAKCAWRLLPLIIAAYVVNYLDRTNVGFAALTMNADLGFSPVVYGLGAGIFFVSYSLFQVPSNLMLHRVGARRWISCIIAGWGAAAAAGALINSPESFYALRFLLGVAEAGFFPGIILYFTFWFPKAYLGRVTAMFMSAASVSLIVGGPLASLLLGLDGVAGIHGWQWLFLLEGLPACLLGLAVLRWLPDEPANAPWLNDDERALITSRIRSEETTKNRDVMRALQDPRVLVLGLAYGGIIFGIVGLNYWLPLMVQGMGFSNAANGFVVALVYAAGVPVMILWGRSSDRRGERIWHAAIPALFAAAAFATASVAQSDTVVLLALACSGIGLSSALSPFYGLPALFLSGPAMAGGFALISAIASLLGGFAGQYLIGAIREETGGYAVVLAALSAALLLSAIIVLALARNVAPQTVKAADA